MHASWYSYAVTAYKNQESEVIYAMSKAYRKKQRNRNEESDSRRPKSADAKIKDRQHRSHLAEVRTLTGVDRFPLGQCTRGTVLLANVDYADGTGSKTRPVVVIRTLNGHTVLVYRCTTKGFRAHGLTEITDLEVCGLSRRTWIDPKPVEIERRMIIKAEGHLSEADEVRLFGASGSGRVEVGHGVSA